MGLLLFNSAPQNEAGEPFIGGWNVYWEMEFYIQRAGFPNQRVFLAGP